MFRIILVSALLVGVLADLKLQGVCDPNIKGASTDDVRPFAGKTWYLIESLGSWEGGNCPTAVADKSSPKETLLTTRKFVFNNKNYEIKRDYTKGPGATVIQNLNAYTVEETRPTEFHLIDTDGKSYTLLYACIQLTPDTKLVSAQKYSTEKVVPADIVAKMHATAEQNPDLKHASWTKHDHSNCSF